MDARNLRPTERFSSRVADYLKYRPGYPEAILTALRDRCGLTTTSVIADIGSGTGLLTEVFLRNGNTVFAVEPNKEMRVAGENYLRRFPGFYSLTGTAEETTLPGDHVDYVIAGQAFHWFKRDLAKVEFSRILREKGWVVLIWNERLTQSSPFLADYEKLLINFATDYTKVDHRNIDEIVLKSFFSPHVFAKEVFANAQHFDFLGLKGRLLSSSYAPDASHPNHGPMIAALRALFDTHQKDQRVVFEYETKMYFGQLS